MMSGKPWRKMLWMAIIFVCCYSASKVLFETAARKLVARQTVREESVKQPAPITENEFHAALDDLDANLASKQSEIEEWYSLNVSSPGGDFKSKLLPDKNFTFRGLNFRMTKNQVRAHEASQPDTIPSPVPALRPEYETYWYYLGDGMLGTLEYHFNSAGRLMNILIMIMGQPITEVEAAATMKMMVPIFSSTLGTPKKYSELTYGWLTPALNCFVFAWPSNLSEESITEESITEEMIIVYTPPGSFSDEDIKRLREEMITTEKKWMEMLEQEF